MGTIPGIRGSALIGAAALAAAAGGCAAPQHGKSSIEMLTPITHAGASMTGKATMDASVDAESPEAVGELKKPAYPPAALAAKAGEVVVYATVTIDTDGKVSDVSPSWDRLNIPGPYSDLFLSAVRAAAADWKFIPAHLVHWKRHPNGQDEYLYSELIPAQFDVKFTFEAKGAVR
jgi:hypothetical protein